MDVGVLQLRMLVLACCYFGASFASSPWSPETFPNPVIDPVRCGLQAASRVCDPDEVLSLKTRNELSDLLGLIEEDTEEENQVAVAIVAKMSERMEGWDKMEKAKTFASTLGDSWGVGIRGVDNGVVLFVSKLDRVAYIKTARGAQEALPDNVVNRIISRMTVQFKKDQGNLDAGVLGGVALIYDALKNPAAWKRSWLGSVWDFLGEAGPILLFVVMMFSFSFWPYVALLCTLLCYAVAFPVAWARDKWVEYRHPSNRGGGAAEARPAEDANASSSSSSSSSSSPSSSSPSPEGKEAESGREMTEEERKSAEETLSRIRKEMERKDDEEPTMCCICLEEIKGSSSHREEKKAAATTTLPCSHEFHTECLREWVDSKGDSARCPLCRTDIPYDWDRPRDGAAAGRRADSKMTNVERLEAMLRRFQARFPRWGGGSRRWAPRPQARRLMRYGSARNKWYIHDSDWLFFLSRRYDNNSVVQPGSRYASWTSQLPDLGAALTRANRRMAEMKRNAAKNSRGGSSRSGSSFGGGGGFSSGGGGGGSW